MDSPTPALDLEKELTCSICVELLHQPLTLLDCLHTFCGACLKEWFSFQASKAERAPSPPPPGTSVFTCPSCRAAVRDTRQNAAIVTLLDMLVVANPDKARSQADKDEMARKYTPGDQVLPQLNIRERTVAETRADAADRQLLEEVRVRSLREASTEASPSSTTRRRRASNTADDRPRSSRDRSARSDSRRPRDGSHRPRAEDGARRSADQLAVDGERHHRRRRSESQSRQVEHQSSLRSLIGSAGMSERDIEREIEAFARQIQEEGLLDGLDLDNIDLARNDELSHRITEAYRRRQRERVRRRSNSGQNNGTPRSSEPNMPLDPRLRTPDTSGRQGSRTRHHTRSASASSGALPSEERSRPPTSSSASFDNRDARRGGRRGTSRGRSETTPVPSSQTSATPPASRSQTDLTLRTQPADLMAPPPLFQHGRSVSASSVPHAAGTSSPTTSLNGNGNASFANRAPSGNQASFQEHAARGAIAPSRAAELAVVHSFASSPLSTTAPPRTRPQLYPEPSISCSRCSRSHIEYEVHYNCAICFGGQWNMCLDCYRSGKGCRHWFGFGYGAWTKWEKSRKRLEGKLQPPHELSACRYEPPPSTPGGADGRKTLTTADPALRLEKGTFCARCHIWTNDCYWRCDACNEGEWGFCNNCVNQGKSCSHVLLPLTIEAPQAQGRSSSPRPHGRPLSATILTGPQASSFGQFKPLTFTTRCDVCQDPISPPKVRYHCFSCTSSLIENGTVGDYDICLTCYNSLVGQGQISQENGPNGWRRCLNGHRMVVIGFTNGKVGQWRYVERDLVGGRTLRAEPFDSPEFDGQGLQKWSWRDGDQTSERLVTTEISTSAPSNHGSASFSQSFPPDGGVGSKAVARWAWYPATGAEDELLFPKGAEIREIDNVNGDWFYGTYMGTKGLFPAPYVQLEQGSEL